MSNLYVHCSCSLIYGVCMRDTLIKKEFQYLLKLAVNYCYDQCVALAAAECYGYPVWL